MNLEIKMNKIELRKKIKENLDNIVILDIHPKLGYTCTFDNDFLTVHYHDIMGKEFSSATYTLNDYQKQWDFETPDYYDSKADENITAAELLAITENALNEKADKFAKAVNVCVNEIVEDITLNVRHEAERGRTEYTSKVAIIGNKYLDKSITDDTTCRNFVEVAFQKLKAYYEAKGFYVEGETNNSGAIASTFTVSWQAVNKASISPLKELEDSEDLTHESIQTNEDLNKILKDACDGISRTPFDLPRYNFHKAEGLHPDLVCPYCGARHYEEGATMQSLAYVPRIYKDGILQDTPNPNWTITHYRCLECGKQFETKNGKIQKMENLVTAQGGEINVQS
jgi:DNA-directed RNA polymerase subunit RPC12/RpoP